MSLNGQVALWMAGFTLLGPLGAPFGRALFPEARDGGAGAGRLLALLAWMFLFWIVPSLTPLPASALWAILSLGTVALASFWIRSQVAGPLPGRWSGWLESGIFLVFFSLFLWVRSYTSEIWGVDKNIDYMIFHSLTLTDQFPPEDRWFSGSPLNYYYLGHLVFVPLTKIVALPSEVALNLAFASVLPTLAGVLLSTLGHFRRERTVSWVFAAGAALIGTWATPYLLAFGEKSFTVWGTSDVLKGAIVEVPMFSFFMGALHAYFITLPATLLTAAVIVEWAGRRERASYILAAVSGALVGLHDGLHTWSLPPLICLASVLWVFVSRDPGKIRSAGIFISAAIIAALPFAWHQHGVKMELAWVPAEWRSSFGPFLLHWGAFLLPCAVLALPRVASMKAAFRWAVPVVAVVSFLLGGVTSAFLAVLIAAYSRPRSAADGLILTSLLILLGCEFVYIPDPALALAPRTNTVFKFYYVAWGFLALSVPLFFSSLPRWGKWSSAIGFGLAMLLFPATWWRQPKLPEPTLNGLAWVGWSQPDDAAAVDWLRQTTSPRDRIVEAAVQGTRNYGILSAYSGRPTVMGLSNQEAQFRTDESAEIMQRLHDVEEIYSTGDDTRLRVLLARYGVKYVAVGARERAAYPLARLEAVGRLPVVFDRPSLRIYRVPP